MCDRVRAPKPTISDFDIQIPEKRGGCAAEVRPDLPLVVDRSTPSTMGHERPHVPRMSIPCCVVRRIDVDRIRDGVSSPVPH
ncbi:hypothetical protein [Burkholderia sp. LA-2-3-30-S1-D2]|uniref:hypothetical protein n=1 Tax=Burkholderia sp. LA-2-3-30-S1-D2 TaxID=1637862 RepID=UPI00131F1C2A|nr:hypothetical protein [Burkholderia sp. LA-2-3-30-S1-D2]